jgi:prefoldin subunit 5
MEQTEPDPLKALIAAANEIASELALLEADAGLLRERTNELAMQLALLPEVKLD